MAAPPAGQANERIAVDIHPIRLEELQQIRLPASVRPSVFQRAVDVARRFDKYEGKPTGCQLVLGYPSMKEIAASMEDPEEPQSSLLGKFLEDCRIESMLRDKFSRDGGILIDGHSGEILETKSIFSYPKSDLVCAGHGTRHNTALQVAASVECVVIVRSQDGYVTVFSSEHLRKQDGTPRCFRLNVEEEPIKKEILIYRTPLVRSTRDSTGSEKLVVPREATTLKSLPPPVRVAEMVGPGRTGKSTLAGAVAQTKSLLPSAETTKAVREGIYAAAVKHPDGGSLILLVCEGFDNPLAPSRTDTVNLWSLLCSLLRIVKLCREVHKCSGLTCNQQPFDGQMFLNLVHTAVAGINAAEPLHTEEYLVVLRQYFGRSTEQALDEVKRKVPADGPDPHHLEFPPENKCKGKKIQKRECEERLITGEIIAGATALLLAALVKQVLASFAVSGAVSTFSQAAADKGYTRTLPLLGFLRIALLSRL